MSRQSRLILMIFILVVLVLGMHQCAKASMRKQKTGESKSISAMEAIVEAPFLTTWPA